MNYILEQIRKNKIYIIVGIIIFILFNISYVFDVSPKFKDTYLPFLFEFNLTKFLSILFISLFITVIGGIIKSDFIRLIWFTVLIMQYFGSAVLFTYCPKISFGIVLQNIILLFFIFIGDFVNPKLPSINISLSNNYKYFLILAVLLFAPFIYYYWQYISIENLLLDKTKIYETRELFRHVNVPVLGYLISPLSRIIFPILMIYAISSKKYYLFVISAIAIAYLFLCSATKSVLIGGILAVFFYYGKEWKDKFKLFSILIISLIITSFIASYFFHFKDITDAFVRRVFFVPPYLDNVYHQYFSSNFTFWGHSPFGLHLHNIDYMNGKGITMFMGEDVMKFKGLNANIGIITEGYLSFGYIGVIIHSIIFSSIFIYIKRLNISPYYYGIIFAYLFYLNSSLLSTLLLTHGLVFLLIVFTLFLQNSKESSLTNNNN